MNKSKYISETISGILPLTISDSTVKGYARGYKLYGSSIQEGIPSYESPVEVQSVGELVAAGEFAGKYKIPLLNSSKNLIDFSPDNLTPVLESGYYGFDFGVLPQGRYTFSFSLSASAIPQYLYIYRRTEGVETWLAYLTTGNAIYNNPYSFTADGLSQYYIGFALRRVGTSKELSAQEAAKMTDMQLEKGSVRTEYEAHRPTYEAQIYLDEPLRKVGEYTDEVIALENGTGRLIRRVGYASFTGSDGKTYNMMPDGSYPYITGFGRRAVSESAGICNYIKYHGDSNIFVTNGTIFRLRELHDIFASKNEFVTWLKEIHAEGNTLEIIYPLANPVITELAYRQIKPLAIYTDTNIISADTAVQPSGAEITYKKAEV